MGKRSHTATPRKPHTPRMRRKTYTPSRLPQRKSLRLAEFDYTEPQSYFVTIVARDRRCVFGRVEHGQVVLSPAGKTLAREWRALSHRFGVEIEPFVVMPNHVHGLVSTWEAVDPPALGRIIGAFKSITAREYRTGASAGRWLAMPGGLWQRGYFDHVVRDETDAARIIDYINANPANWVTDPDNPDSPDRTSDDNRLWPKKSAGRHKTFPRVRRRP
ncbi:MAG: transposase [Gammaproteobacteria bacterium]|nr:transposase [Gammaproteobacteria bacterium]MYK46957.1 transposase [Gammaproteobacteria bacterium]